MERNFLFFFASQKKSLEEIRALFLIFWINDNCINDALCRVFEKMSAESVFVCLL